MQNSELKIPLVILIDDKANLFRIYNLFGIIIGIIFGDIIFNNSLKVYLICDEFCQVAD